MPKSYSSATRPSCARRQTGKVFLAVIHHVSSEINERIRSAVGLLGRALRQGSGLALCAQPQPLGFSPRAGLAERLESRTLMSVTTDAAGWTVVTPQTGSRVIYVSSSGGNDNNSGLSPSTPVASLWKGVTLMHNGTGDQLLLKAGDTWHDDFVYWRMSGKSAQEPMVLGSYGSGPRPTVMSGIHDGFATGAASNPIINNLDIIGIHFVADGRDPNYTSAPNTASNCTGINILSQSSNILVENCLVEGYTVNMNYQDFCGPQTNVRVRRNVSIDAYSINEHSQGMYATGVTNLTIEGNVFDHNGWNERVAGATATVYNHDCYLSGHNYNVVVRDNVFARGGDYGLQARSGGSIQNNLFLNNPAQMSFGLVNGASTHPGGVTGDVTGNVFVGGADVGTIHGGSGLELANIAAAGATVSNNIFTHSGPNAPSAITLTYGMWQSNPQDSVGINNLRVQNNIIYGWSRGIMVDGGMVPGGRGLTGFNNVSFTGNQISYATMAGVIHVDPINAQEHWSGNLYSNDAPATIDGVKQAAFPNTPLSYAAAARTVDTYAGSASAFLAGARQQSKQTWNSRYDAASVLAYIKAGFQLTGAAPTPTPSPVQNPPSTASISGTFFYDSNKNGVWNSGEPISPSWLVYVDANRDGRYDAGDTLIRANAAGQYTFSNLAPGTYVIRSATAGGWYQTSPANGGAQVVNVTAGQRAANINFGVVKGTPPAPTPTPAPSTGTRSARTVFQAEKWDAASGVAFDTIAGLGFADGGDWAEYKNVDFGTGVSKFKAAISALSSATGYIELHVDSPTGELIGAIRPAATGSWSNYTVQTTNAYLPKGVHNLYIVFKGGKGVANIDWFTFA